MNMHLQGEHPRKRVTVRQHRRWLLEQAGQTYENLPRHGPDGIQIQSAQHCLFPYCVQAQRSWRLLLSGHPRSHVI